MRAVRGDRIAMIFQEPMSSLNPVLSIGRQLVEAIEAHVPLARAEARARAVEALRAVRLSEPERRMAQYPHELSGGMRQRVMIAMAIALKPEVLIADEPTTALDVTVQREILDLLRDLQATLGTAIILITHDMGVVAEMADRVIVMKAGRVVEEAPVRDALRGAARSLYPRAARGRAAHGRRRRRAARPRATRRSRGLRPSGHLRSAARLSRPRHPPHPRGRGRHLRHPGRRDLRAGGRERLRQVLGRPRHGGPHAVRGRHRDRRPPARRARDRSPGGPARRPDDLPGSDVLARPANARRRAGGRAAGHPRHRHAGRAPRARRRPLRAGRPVARPARPLSARVLRRPAPAHLHRPRAGARAAG